MAATPFDPYLLYRHRRDKTIFVGNTSGNKEDAGHKPTTDVLPDAYGQVSDPSQCLDGLLCMQVDDTIGTGSEQFLEDEDKHSAAFPSKSRAFIREKLISFNGSDVCKTTVNRNIAIVVQQHAYISRLPNGRVERTPKAFGTARGQIAYATNSSRSDGTCRVNILCLVKVAQANEENFKDLERLIADMKNHPLEMTFHGLDLSTVHLRVCSDSSFANNPDLTSQIGYTIFIVDDAGRANLVCRSSRKCRRVTRSVLAAELYALSAAYDMGYGLRHTLSTLLQRTVEMKHYVDSKTIWDSVTSLCKMEERRLSIDIGGLRQAYRTEELRHLGRIDTKYNPSDAMTKSKPGGYLRDVLESGYLRHPVEVTIAHGNVKNP
jgi:hypothetical protein